MLVIHLLCLAVQLVLCDGEQHRRQLNKASSLRFELEQIQTALNLDYDSVKWGVQPCGTRSYMLLAKAFIHHQFHYLINDLPVFVYDAPTRTDSYIGNRLGNYFEAIACAEAAGLHFVCITNQTDANKLASGFSSIRVHPQPAQNLPEAIRNVESKCIIDNPYPWENPLSLQFAYPAVIRDSMGPAVDKFIDETTHTCRGGNFTHYMDHMNVISDGTSDTNDIALPTACVRYSSLGYATSISGGTFDIEGNFTKKQTAHEGRNKPSSLPLVQTHRHAYHADNRHDMMLPLIPSVAILLRCCDILFTRPGQTQYGFVR